jgi:hypothetical protein
MKIFKSLVFFFFILVCVGISQNGEVFISNASFEDIPHMGVPGTSIEGWIDCGQRKFIGESPPDIHPAPGGDGFWQNNLPAADGSTYLGMVVRDNNTYETVGQQLSQPLLKNQCYSFTIFLARAARYVSMTHMTQAPGNYTTPIVLRIWGGRYACDEFELLAESDAVDNTSWQINTFTIKPKRDINFLSFAAFYKTPTLFPYNGNILVDGASSFTRITCPGEEPIAVVESKTTQHNNSPSKTPTSTTKPNNTTKPDVKTNTENQKNSFTPKILTELDSKKN